MKKKESKAPLENKETEASQEAKVIEASKILTPGRDAILIRSSDLDKPSFVQSFYKGPLPPAEQFERYEKAVPGAGKIILEMAEKDLQFRHDRDRTVNRFNYLTVFLAQVLSTLITLSFIGVGGYLLLQDKPIQGLAVAISYPVYMVYQSNKPSKEDNEEQGSTDKAQ